MKKTAYILGSLIFVALTVYLIIPLMSINKFPSVDYLNLQGKKIDVSKIDFKNKGTVLFYVNPTCDACDKIVEITSKLDRNLHNVIVICSYFENTNYGVYKKKFNLAPEDIFLIDKENTFIYDFNIGISYSLPIMLSFDPNGNRIKSKKYKFL